jgi:glycosyltransferase involved in cell wall biosynthesis
MDKTLSVFYCSLARHGSPAANTIQTSHMGHAFAQWVGRVCMVMRAGDPKISPDPQLANCELHILPTGRWRISAWLYSARAFNLYRKLSTSRLFDLVFTRSLIFCLLVTLVRQEPLAMELHTGIRSSADRLIFRFLCRRGVHFVCITESIAHELRAALPGYTRVHVAHDGHNFPIVEQTDVGPSRRSPMRVGYFGSLTQQKGLDILQSLVDTAQDFEFHIFSKETSALRPGPALRSYRYLKPTEVYEKMLGMDAFLLTVVPQEKNDRISGYTSPLKLYEYLAAGRPILVSDLPVLREDVDEESVFFCQNSFQDFRRTLVEISSNRDGARAKAIRGLSLARERTWYLRARQIIEACGIEIQVPKCPTAADLNRSSSINSGELS